MKKYSLMLLFVLFSSFLVVPTASAACPEIGSQEFGDVGEQVQLIACTDQGLRGGNQSVTIGTPVATLPGAAAASAVGDLLIAVVQTDGAAEDLDDPTDYDADWTPAIGTPYIDFGGVTSMIWTRIADGTESESYTFGWDSSEQVYGYILRFTGASGLYQMSTNGTGTSNNPIANTVTANAANSLILRMLSVDRRPIVQDVSPNPAVHTLITIEAGRPKLTGGGGGATVSGGASYTHQALAGTSSGNASFSNLTGSEQWHTRTMAIEPYEFRFSMPDATAGVCGTQLVTLSVTDSSGAIPPGSAMENFAGEVTISASFSAGATWNDGPGLTNSIVDNGNGNATYQFDPADNGVAVFEFHNSNLGSVVDFDVSYGNFGESINYVSPALTIINCEFVVTNDVGDEVGTCAMEAVTITLQDTDGNPADTYSGTLSIGNGSSDTFGNYVLNAGHTGAGSFVDAIADDGKAEYTFALTPSSGSNELVLDYIHGSTDLASIDFAITEDSGDNFLVASITSLDVIACEIIVTLPDGDDTRDVCTMTRVRFEIQAGGATVTNYTGVLNIATSAGQGLWFENVAEQPYPGTLSGGYGTVSYDFNGSEAGIVILDFRNQVTATNLSVTATGLTDEGIALPQGGAIPVFTDIAQCTITITTANATVNNISDVCRAAESVTYTLTDRDGGAATAFTGTVFMQTSTNAGNYELTAGAGTLTGPGGNDGFASYAFDSTDNGVFTVGYSVLAAPGGLGDVMLTATLISTTLVNTDGTLRFRNCVFNISYPSDTAPFETDVCSIKQVRIDLVDFDGDPVTDYTGTINLSTSTGFGSWSADVSANGTVSDPFGEDGSASYTFVDLVAGTDPGDDDGVVLLNFTHTAAAAAAMNIDVTDSITSDPGNPGTTDDPNLVVDVCTVQISFDGGGASAHGDAEITACEVQAVTIEVFDSTGALATDYAGQINFSTSTNNGNWSINSGNGSLSDVGGAGDFVAGDGVVFYTFNDDGIGLDDDGVVILDFSNQNAETVNFNVVDQIIALGLDGVIVEEGAADPSLEIGSCIPAVQSHTCAIGGSGISTALTIDPQATDPNLRGRMVVIATSHEGDADVTNVTFGGIGATKLLDIRADEGAFDSNTELWAIDDATMPNPGVATSYNAVVTHGDTSLGVCALYVDDVEQAFPMTVANPNEDDGQINATSSIADQQVASTTVTTTEKNALIVSVVGNGSSGSYDNVSPSPPMLRLFNENPALAVFSGSTGNAPTAASITIDETSSVAANLRHTHIVAAFNPLISGPPVAATFEPVVLFQTYSGNLSYRAIGASFQDGPNSGGVCSLVNPLEATANLQLPDAADVDLAANGDPFSAAGEFDSDVQAAWLYWFASGSFDLPNMDGIGAFPNTKNPDDFDNVTFTTPDGLGGFNVTNLIADDIFTVENVGGNNNADFYVAYKDVTNVMVGSDNELVGSDEDPNGDYTISNIVIDDNQPWLGRGSCAGGFALVVVYENPYEQLRVINLFHGFQPFQNSAFTLVPRNFRIAARDTVTNTPNGQVTHITVEGDVGLSGANEALTIQDTPGDFDPLNFNGLATDFNPADEEFNGTVTRPVYALTDVVTGGVGEPAEYKYIFDSSSGVNGNPSNGYEIDFPNPAVFPFTPPGAAETAYGLSYGVDIDTHFIDGDEVGDILYNFADPTDLAEEITTRYAADQDLVMLVAEIISVNNAPIADIEVTITEDGASTFKVGSTSVYNIEVKNNGNGAVTFGSATGIIELVGELPAGMTFNNGGGEITGAGWVCTDSVDSTTAFTCTYDITANLGVGGLGDASLPTVSAVVTIDQPPVFFPSLNNDAKVIVRVQHSDGTCGMPGTGILPLITSSCEAPEFDNVFDLQGGALDINDIDDKTGSNNNVDSITTNVQGIETDLSVVKTVTTILEEGSSDSILYTITVTNNGPDDVGALTQPTITITDNEPVGVNFDSASGTDWTCNVNAGAPDQLVCDFDNSSSMTPLNSGESSVITVVGDVTGTSPGPVTNTVQVSSGTYDFDNVPGNNTFGTTDNIDPVPPAVTDRFLLSVSAAAAMNTTSLGSGGGLLSDFSDDDIVLYDPLTDSAELFIDSATVPDYSVTDPNAIHLLPNGQVVLSANADGNSIGTNMQGFDKDDIVLYDKLLNTATLLFDGSAFITDDAMDAIDLNIDAVYVLDDGSIVFSTAGPASGNRTGGGTESWSDSDLVRYDPSDDTFLVYLDAEDDNVFGAVDAQVDAAYIRVDPADATMVLDTFVLSSEVQGAVLGDNNIVVGRDDVAEITIDTGTPAVPTATTSTNLFNGGIPIGVFDTMEVDLKINALHIIETGYLGDFAISEITPGDACSPARIRITKELGDTTDTDTDYEGSIIITADSGTGSWTVDTGTSANLDNSFGGSSDNGQALYTFASGDNGVVILNLDVTQEPPVSASINISVTNGFVTNQDGPYALNLVPSDVNYLDEFGVPAFDNSDGEAGWAIDWVEVDAFSGMASGPGLGMTTGNIQMTGGKLTFTSNLTTDGGAVDPSMTRAAGLGLFDYEEPVFIKYHYGYSSASAAGDVIELQISNDDVSYITVQTYDMLDGTSGSDIGETIDISAFITNDPADDMPDDPNLIVIDSTDTDLYVRWVLVSGYVLGSFTVDNFEVETSTNSCADFSSLDHYHIDIPATGLACVASAVTITAHTVQHGNVEVDPGTVLNLSTSNNAGSWASIVSGGGVLVDTTGVVMTDTDGMGTYTFPGGEASVSLAFNYTDPLGDTPAVNIDVVDGNGVEELKVTDPPLFDDSHDPDSVFAEAGLLFYDEAASSNFTQLPFQIAGKPALTAPASGNVTLQIVRSVPIPGENAAAACESLVSDGEVVTVKLAGLCVDPMSCDVSTMSVYDSAAAEQTMVPIFDSPTANPEQSGLALTLLFEDQGVPIDGENNIGAQVNFMYPDSGKISLHAEYELTLNDDIAGFASGDTINGASSEFVVRPFGFDIDFGSSGDDREMGGALSVATDATGPAFARAGVGFEATVSAVLWEQADDGDMDGIPDVGADLSNNPVATNFGDEAVDNNTVIVSVRTDNPGVLGGVNGAMVTVDGSTDVFQGFSGGFSGPQNIAINEVGIFNLSAELVDNAMDRNPINYFETTPYTTVEGVVGGVVNVGRIYPNHFELQGAPSFSPRVNQGCSPASTFTYMGEGFGVNFTIEAKNFQDQTTQNYFDDFAKLNSFDELNMGAIIDVDGGADIDVTARLTNSAVPDPGAVGSEWAAGVLTLGGDLNIARLASGEDAPLKDVKIVFAPTDNNINDMDPDDFDSSNDVILNVYDVELDDGMPDVDPLVGPWDFKELATHEFRYGRLLVENAYGSGFEDLDIGLSLEYFDGNDFVVNTDDSCTQLPYTVASQELDFVAGSYESNDAGNLFEAGDTTIENGMDFTIEIFQGQTSRLEDGNDDDEDDTDRPFFTTAPVNEESGRVLVELDLDATSLDFLKYDWRGGAGEDPGDPYDEEPEGMDYDDNPRGIVEFGSYRGHDRVINWQEIYIGPGP